MTLTQLRTFLAVADTGSVRAAAGRLLVAQPSVSAAVSSLERELGVKLVAREGRGIRLTEAGEAFARSVSESLGLLSSGVRTARAVAAPGGGEVRIAAVTTAAERLLLRLIAEFKIDHDQAGVTLQVGNRTSIWESLRSRQADLVVAGRPPLGTPAVVLATAENSLVLVAPAAAQPELSDLADTTWLLREEGSGTREATEELLASLGVAPPTMILGSNGAVERGVSEGLGVALISRHAVADALAARSVRVLACPGTPLERPWHLVCHGDEGLNPTSALLVRSMARTGQAPGIALTREGRKALSSALSGSARPARRPGAP